MHRTMMMMLYATGLRRAEMCHLKVTDIDSKRMVIHVRQGNARAKWLAARSAELLPVPYFHVVFTLPHELSALVLQNKRLLYDLLNRSLLPDKPSSVD
jgi:integrase